MVIEFWSNYAKEKSYFKIWNSVSASINRMIFYFLDIIKYERLDRNHLERRNEMEPFAEYLEAIGDEGHRDRIREVLNWVKHKFPNLESKIAWNQPMFTDHGTFIIGFSISKQHFAVSPEVRGIDEFSEEIIKSGYSHGKNIFRIKWDDPIDYPLLERMIQYNIKDKEDCTAFWRK